LRWKSPRSPHAIQRNSASCRRRIARAGCGRYSLTPTSLVCVLRRGGSGYLAGNRFVFRVYVRCHVCSGGVVSGTPLVHHRPTDGSFMGSMGKHHWISSFGGNSFRSCLGENQVAVASPRDDRSSAHSKGAPARRGER
jgi:hypothetical protein